MPRNLKAQDETPERSATRRTDKTDTQSENHVTFQPYAPSKVYRLIEPGPVLLVSTGSLADSTHNLMTIGFHMVLQHESPPLIAIVLGPWNASFAALKKQRECVLAIPSVQMAETVVDIGNCSADDGDDEETSKWDRFGIEAVPAGRVGAPLVGGADVIANIECVVADTKMVRSHNMWVLKPVQAWLNDGDKDKTEAQKKTFHHRGNGTFVVDGEVLDLQDRMVKWQEYTD